MDSVNDILSDIGMHSYQWQLFLVCGSGWIADNMWLQGLSAVLPKVQEEYKLDNEMAGLIIMTSMLGMMVGGSIWGFLSDRIGRKSSFTYTLIITFVFGLLSSISNSFPLLCVLLFLMGSGVGGNLPVDGALFLEFMPLEKQGLLTLLSIFWPVGSVIASCLAWALIPNFIDGWRYVLFSMGIITLIMVLMRTVFFKLYESPKFLVSHKKYDDAYRILRILAEKNNVELRMTLEEFKEGFLKSGENDTREIDLETHQLNCLFKSRSFTDSEEFKILFSPQYRITTILVWYYQII